MPHVVTITAVTFLYYDATRFSLNKNIRGSFFGIVYLIDVVYRRLEASVLAIRCLACVVLTAPSRCYGRQWAGEASHAARTWLAHRLLLPATCMIGRRLRRRRRLRSGVLFGFGGAAAASILTQPNR